MTDSARPESRWAAVITRVASSPLTVWLAFVLVHLWLGMLNLFAPGLPLGDVTNVYTFWMDQALHHGFWVGIDSAWVYPILALVPMLVSVSFGFPLVASTWLTMVMLLNAVAFGVLTRWGRDRERTAIAWWWLGFLLLLGPIALGRIDSVTVPIALVGVLALTTRPRLAAVALTVATWIKVWPAAIIAAILISARERWQVLATAVATSVVVIIGALALGAGGNVASFVTQQTGRGLQIEAPISTPWLWQAFAGVPATFVYYDQQILTYQVEGVGTAAASAIMTPVLAVVVIVVCVLGVLATRAGATVGALLPPLSLALVMAFIAFNKVGSPQYVSWIAVPVILGLVTAASGRGPSFRTPATLTLVIAGLTQAIYPYLYTWLVYVNPVMLVVLTARNLLLFVLLGWAVAELWQAAMQPGGHYSREETARWTTTVWPLGPGGGNAP